MNRIRLLPDYVANQIAAGEVVERPASVVKELVENSIDARSTKITVEISSGGRSLIRVTDDGIGMSRDDALLSLERHATSKIQKAEDLHSVTTMGFRGEALPSIASVSKFVLTTRERDDNSTHEATQIIVNGGKIIAVKAAGAPAGTTVEVRQLFFNLPARRKFLRSQQTEEAHIQHYLTLAAIAYPEIAFEYIRDGNTVFQLPAVKSDNRLNALRERLRALKKWEQEFLPLDIEGELKEDFSEIAQSEESFPIVERVKIKLLGFIGAPGISRATRDEQHLFVNRRPVENKGLNYALLEGYHTALMKGRYPVCVLFLEIDPAAVDVNIHPTKREVKFRNERLVRQFVSGAIRSVLFKLNEEQSAVPNHQNAAPQLKPLAKTATTIGSAEPAQLQLSTKGSPLPVDIAVEPLINHAQTVLAIQSDHQNKQQVTEEIVVQQKKEKTDDSTNRTQITSQQPGGATPLLKVPLRYLGVIGKLYIVMESDRGLVLLDQHAAHERILFEQMIERVDTGETPSQRLLLPETVEVGARETDILRKHLQVLNKLGIGLSEFGERTFILDSLPTFLKVSHPGRFVLNLIDELKTLSDELSPSRLSEEIIAKTVCRHAVKANDPLTEPELMELIEKLKQCKMPYTCPHGRPTIIEINFRELAKKFGRIV
ncbi:MAG: DNA mismatch repair endonuclease MutL [Verrucomicrobiia bacterium]